MVLTHKKRIDSTADPDGQRSELLELWRGCKNEASVADTIYETLREAILRGVLPPGERLAEEHLANLFMRSRTPIREAILRLESERLAERLPRRGLVVARISREEVLAVYAIREVLDGLSARLAAQGILSSEYEHLVWLNQRMREAAEQSDFARMLDLNIEFHEALCEASRNTLLLQFVRQIHDWVRRFRETTFSYPGRSLEAVNEHEDLLEAVMRRDPQAAEWRARHHMSRAREVRVAMFHSSSQET